MTRMDERRLDDLLSPSELSGPEHDRILARVTADVRRAEARPSWRRATLWTVVALASCLVVFVLRRAQDDGGFRARGTGTGLVVEAQCLGACTPNSKVMLALSNVSTAGRVIVQAISPSGVSTEYFGDERVFVGLGSERQLLSRALVFEGAEPGEWTLRVHVRSEHETAEGTARLHVGPP